MTIYNRVDPKGFTRALSAILTHEPGERADKIRAALDGEATNVHNYTDAKTFLADDRLSGYAVREDGDLVSVWSAVKGRGDELVESALENGATRLDCFDGYLPTFYARHGFYIVHREANWTPGGPDVVFMERYVATLHV